MVTVALDLLVFGVGALGLVALARWWRPELSWRVGGGAIVLSLMFVGPGLLTTRHLTATDMISQWRPWAQARDRAVPANDLLSDPVLQMLPFRTLARERLLAGELPLWAHELGTGQPLLGNAQSAPFAPLGLLALPLPPLRAADVVAGWSLLVALVLMFLLVSRLAELREPNLGSWAPHHPGAALAAIAWAWSTYVVVWLLYPLGQAVVWLPGVVLGVISLARAERGGFAGLVACTVAMALSGHPETLLHATLVAATVGLACWWRSPRRGAVAREGALAVALAGALAAPALLPILEALPESERMAAIAERPDAAAPVPFQLEVAVLALDPLRHGSPRDRNWQAPTSNFNELASAWAGAIPLALALAAAVALRGWRLAAMAGGAVALAVALRAPGLYDAFVAIPGFAHGAHGRLRLVWVLAVAVVAGSAVGKLQHSRSLRWMSCGMALGLAVTLAVLGTPSQAWQRAWWLLALTGLATLLAVAWRPRLGTTPLALALLLELGVLGIRYNPATVATQAPEPLPGVLAFLVAEAGGRHDPPRVLAEDWNLLPNLAALAGLGDPRGNDPMRPAWPARLVGERLAGEWRPGFHSLLPAGRFDIGLFDFLGVESLLVPARRFTPDGWFEVYRGEGGKLLRNPDAQQRFFVPTRVLRAPSRESALEQTLTLPDPAAVVVIEGPPLGGQERAGPPTARVVSSVARANGFDLEVAVLAPAILASSVSWAPGWRLEIDGKRRSVRRVAGAFLAAELEPGDRMVRWSYRPRSFSIGALLAAVAVVGIAVASLLRRGGFVRAREIHPSVQLRSGLAPSGSGESAQG